MAADPGGSTAAVDHVEVGLAPPQGPCKFAYVLVKLAYAIRDGSCVPSDPEPLIGDFRKEDTEPRLQQLTDYWAFKSETDFIVRGSACAPGGGEVRRMEISLDVGDIQKRVAVFGRRPVEWDASGRPRFPEPEPFTEIELCHENTYGGVDWRVPVDENDPKVAAYALEADFPGAYPRNPAGKGYVVIDGPYADLELPHFEDPDDLLTAGRLVTGDPRLWWKQPIPWTVDAIHATMFPRCVLFIANCDAWFPGPEDETLPEVGRGFLMPGYRTLMSQREDTRGPHGLFYQEASPGLILQNLTGGTPVRIFGMHPIVQDMRFALPGPPSIELEADGRRSALAPRLTSVICRPGEQKMTMTFAATTDQLPRVFIPGVHKHIPLSARINGGPAVHYPTPPTVMGRIREAEERVAREGAQEAQGADPERAGEDREPAS